MNWLLVWERERCIYQCCDVVKDLLPSSSSVTAGPPLLCWAPPWPGEGGSRSRPTSSWSRRPAGRCSLGLWSSSAGSCHPTALAPWGQGEEKEDKKARCCWLTWLGMMMPVWDPGSPYWPLPWGHTFAVVLLPASYLWSWPPPDSPLSTKAMANLLRNPRKASLSAGGVILPPGTCHKHIIIGNATSLLTPSD